MSLKPVTAEEGGTVPQQTEAAAPPYPETTKLIYPHLIRPHQNHHHAADTYTVAHRARRDKTQQAQRGRCLSLSLSLFFPPRCKQSFRSSCMKFGLRAGRGESKTARVTHKAERRSLPTAKTLGAKVRLRGRKKKERKASLLCM